MGRRCRSTLASLFSVTIQLSLRSLLVLVALLLPAAASGEEDAPRAAAATEADGAGLAPDAARMASVLDGQLGSARFWYWGWTGFYSSVIAGEIVINATSTGAQQIAAQVNIITSVFGLFSTLLVPAPVTFDWEPVGRMPETTSEERAAKSAAVRALFEREVKKERFYHSVWNHLIGLTVNAAVCAYMYWGLHIGGRALLNLVFGSLVWEANIFTSPNASMHLADELQGPSAVRLQVVPLALGTTGAGVALVGRF